MNLSSVNPEHTSTIENRSLSLPNVLLRVEGFAMFAAGIVIFAGEGGAWWVFLLLLLAPDVAMLGYLVNTRVGAIIYNLAHLIVFPLALMTLGASGGSSVAIQLGAIWLAHVGMDRTVGYGLKYASGFKDTHLQRV